MEACSIAPKRDRILAVLEEFLRVPDVLGATLVSRDGVPIANTEKRVLAPEAFAAMTAALMSAAETAFYQLGGGTNVRVTAETDSNRLIAVGASDELLLVILTRTSTEPARVMPLLEETAGRIRAIMAEA